MSSLAPVTLSVVIPCFNERSNLESVLAMLHNAPYDKEIIAVDDGSNDGSREYLEQQQALGTVNVFKQHETNLGKGAAIKTGIQAASGDIVIIQDADMEYDANQFPSLVEPIAKGEADVVYGSRFLGSRPEGSYLLHYCANRFLTIFFNCCARTKLTDMETCYKTFRREIIQSIEIEEQRFGFEPEITAKIAKRGIKILEVPVSYRARKYDSGKKIGFKDGIRAIYCILKYNFF